MSGVMIEEEADYGRPHLTSFSWLVCPIFLVVLFDLGTQDRWDHNATGESREQWDRLVWEWESLMLIERYLYQERAESEGAPPELSEETKRVLATNQTAHERNISLKDEQMKAASEIPGVGVSGDKILDDPSRYSFDDSSVDSWRQVLVRLPGITDLSGVWGFDGGGSGIRYRSGQNDEEMIVQYQEDNERWRDVSLAQLRIQAGLYLMDREAIESGLIKILWLDEHGQIAWENPLDPFTSSLSRLTGCLLNATSLVELAGYEGTRGALIEN